MVMLTYASVPLYRLFCQVTGFAGATRQSAVLPSQTDKRTIRITFNADTDPNLPWKFKSGEYERTVHVGENGFTFYTAKNLTDKTITGRAIYNVVPHKAGAYFVKVECFCFQEQSLKPYEDVHMPVSFFLDPALLDDPEMNDVDTITLSYTFFPAKP